MTGGSHLRGPPVSGRQRQGAGGRALGRCCAAAVGPRVLLLGWRAGWAAEAHAVRRVEEGGRPRRGGATLFFFLFFKTDFSNFLSFFQQSKSDTSN